MLKQFPKADPALIDNVMQADPSINKQYSRFILQWALNGSIRLPEDSGRLSRSLSFFGSNFNKFQKKDISAYPTFNDFEFAVDSVIDIMQGKDNRSNRQVVRDIKTEGTREVYRDNEWRIIEMTTPQAVCELGKGTKWCTAADDDGLETAESYLQSGSLFLILYNSGTKWEKYAQFTKDLDQIMDVRDRQIVKPPQSLVVAIKSLIEKGILRADHFWENFTASRDYEGVDQDFVNWFKYEEEKSDGFLPNEVLKEIFRHIKSYGVRMPAVENNIIFTRTKSDKKKYHGLIDGDRISEYLEAIGVNKRIKEKEPAILQSTFAMEYYMDFYNELKGYNRLRKEVVKDINGLERWPELEQAFLSNPYRSEEMVEYLWQTNGHKRAEPIFEQYLLNCAKQSKSQSFEHCIQYAKNCNMRWDELEKAILSTEDPASLTEYAEDILRQRWPEAEPLILNNTWNAYLYAREVIRGRWPELEKILLRSGDGWTSAAYAVNVMRSRWPEMERYMKNFGFDNTNQLYEKTFGVKLKEASMTWYKRCQRLTPQQMGMYQNFKSPTGVQLKGSGMSAVFQIPGINQTINGAQLMNQVVARIKGVLNQNNVHTIDTSPVSRADAIGLAVSSEPGTVHVDIAKIFNIVKNQTLPAVTQLDGTTVDKDVQNDIIGKISSYITNQLANTAAHESQHNIDYFQSFPKGKFESPEGGAEAFGNQIANQYFRP